MTTTMPDGRLVRLVPQDGTPTEPGLYLAEYEPRPGAFVKRHTIAREVRIDGDGCLDHGRDSTRLEWWARVVLDAPAGSTAGVTLGGGLIRGGTVDGDAIGQRGEGAGVAELSTPGRGGGRPTGPGPHQLVAKVFLEQIQADREALRARVADLERALADADGCRQLALGRALQAEARVAELEAARLWVMEGLRSCEVRAGEPTDAEMEAAGAVDKRLLTAGGVNDLCRQVEGLTDVLGITRRDREDPVHAARVLMESVQVDRARLAELEAAARWVPVGERLPDFGVTVEMTHEHFGTLVGCRLVGAGRWWGSSGSGGCALAGVTHWRPLPAGPEVQP